MTLVLLFTGSEALSPSQENRAFPKTRFLTYVQGTVVKMWVDIADADTREPVKLSSEDLILSIDAPGEDLVLKKLSLDEVFEDLQIKGRYWSTVDTLPAPGRWSYQYAMISEDTVVARSRFHIRAALPTELPVAP